MEHRPFRFTSGEELLDFARSLGIGLPWSADPGACLQVFQVGGRPLPNRLLIQPMEGLDGRADGTPGRLTFRRYKRYAQGGAGLIWVEACAVSEEGRSNPRQLFLHRGNKDVFAEMPAMIRKHAWTSPPPLLVIQLTDSGLYRHRQALSAKNRSDDSGNITGVKFATDRMLEQFADNMIKAAGYARDAGFDGVDIKACHGYLLHEILSAFEVRGSPYRGPSLENRSRLLLQIIEGIRTKLPDLLIAVRLNVYDGLAYPEGFGSSEGTPVQPDLTEPLQLVEAIYRAGCRLLNVTMGIPTVNPHLVRPFDTPLPGSKPPPEHPLEGAWRQIQLASAIKNAFPEMAVAGSGYSWFRQLFPGVAAGVIENGMADLAGLGRLAFAYPDVIKDLKEKGFPDPGKVCITCSGCTRRMRERLPTGCIVRDREVYRKTEPVPELYEEGYH